MKLLVHQISRRDIGNRIIHWTQSRRVLVNILESGVIRGGVGYIKGSRTCVCFSEAPIAEWVAFFNMAVVLQELKAMPRYVPYGVSILKEEVFAAGGRPVIYQTDEERELLRKELQWRHCRFEPANDIDHTWEREWRIETDGFTLSPETTLVFVPSARAANSLAETLNETWQIVPLDFLGLLSKKELKRSPPFTG
jgi:hypothetical protein